MWIVTMWHWCHDGSSNGHNVCGIVWIIKMMVMIKLCCVGLPLNNLISKWIDSEWARVFQWYAVYLVPFVFLSFSYNLTRIFLLFVWWFFAKCIMCIISVTVRFWSPGPLLLTWINFYLCMDKSLHTRWSGVEITYPFPNFIVCTIEVIDLMNNFIPRV